MQRADHCRQNASVSLSDTLGSGAAGGGRCDGPKVRTNGTLSPAEMLKSAVVERSSPVNSTGVRSTAVATSDGRGIPFSPDGRSVNPRHRRAIVEAKREFHPNARATRPSLDNANDGGVRTVHRHEIDDGERTILSGENILQYQCIAAIGPRALIQGGRGRDRPAAMI